MSPAQDLIGRSVEEEQDRIDLIPNLVEENRFRGKLISKIIRPQYWRNAKLIDSTSHVLVACTISITVLSIHPSFPEIVAAATLAKALANSAVIKLQTTS